MKKVVSKKLLFVVVPVIIAVIIGGIILHGRSAKTQISHFVNSNYEELERVVEKVSAYETDAYFSIATKEDLEEDELLSTAGLTEGQAYVMDKNNGEASAYDIKTVKDEDIRWAMTTDPWIRIDKKDDAIVFFTNIYEEESDFHGFYYSMNGRPLDIHAGEDDPKEPLEKHKDGWRRKGSTEGDSYYTEKIKGNFYYYGGTFWV